MYTSKLYTRTLLSIYFYVGVNVIGLPELIKHEFSRITWNVNS